jgi:hypothetical protein
VTYDLTKVKAIFLIRAVLNELKSGTKHYDKQGNLLTDPRSILLAIQDDGIEIQTVTGDPPVYYGQLT